MSCEKNAQVEASLKKWKWEKWSGDFYFGLSLN